MRKSWVQIVDGLVTKHPLIPGVLFSAPSITQSILNYSGRFSTLISSNLTVVFAVFYPSSTPPITTNVLNNYLITNRGCV